MSSLSLVEVVVVSASMVVAAALVRLWRRHRRSPLLPEAQSRSPSARVARVVGQRVIQRGAMEVQAATPFLVALQLWVAVVAVVVAARTRAQVVAPVVEAEGVAAPPVERRTVRRHPPGGRSTATTAVPAARMVVAEVVQERSVSIP